MWENFNQTDNLSRIRHTDTLSSRKVCYEATISEPAARELPSTPKEPVDEERQTAKEKKNSYLPLFFSKYWPHLVA